MIAARAPHQGAESFSGLDPQSRKESLSMNHQGMWLMIWCDECPSHMYIPNGWAPLSVWACVGACISVVPFPAYPPNVASLTRIRCLRRIRINTRYPEFWGFLQGMRNDSSHMHIFAQVGVRVCVLYTYVRVLVALRQIKSEEPAKSFPPIQQLNGYTLTGKTEWLDGH